MSKSPMGHLGRCLLMYGGVLCALLPLAMVSPSEAAFRAGAGKRSITPVDWNLRPYYLAGFGLGRQATGVHDNIWARAVVMDDGNREVVFITLDVVGWMPWRINAMKAALAAEQGLNVDNIVIMATHNHEAPDTMGQWGPGIGQSGINGIWMNYIDDMIKEAVLDARRSYQPARMRFGAGSVPGLNRDSRDPQVIDDAVTVMQALTEDGNAIFTMVNHGTHPEVMWDDNTLITSDFPHFVYEEMEATYGGMAIWSSGALGGLITPLASERTFAETKRVADQISAAAKAGLANATVYENPTMEIQRRRVGVPISNPLFYALAFINTFEVDFEWFVDNNFEVPCDVQYWVMKDNTGQPIASVATAFGEVFPETWLNDLKPNMPGTSMLFGLGNGELGYLVPEDVFLFPENPFDAGENYEETNSPGIEAVPLLRETLWEMIGIQSPTPTPTITATPTATTTPSPTPTPAASVYLAGYMTTRLRAGQPQQVSLLALALSHPGNQVRQLAPYLDFAPVAAPMIEDPVGSGIFRLREPTIPLPGDKLQYLLLLQPIDERRDAGLYWPYLNVLP